MRVDDPAAVLFTDLDGVHVGLDEVVYDGYERDYRIRYPKLRWLLDHGEPTHRLDACFVLTSWGVREGLLTVAEWARTPENLPWTGAPVSVDRFTGVDNAFSHLLDALRRAGEGPLTEATAALRALAVREVLVAHDRIFVDRSMATLLAMDAPLAAACRPEIEWAVERTLAAARAERWTFDAPSQAAFLLAALAELDDGAAAAAAEVLVAEHPAHERALREVALSMGAGRGPATRAVLDRLAAWPLAGVRREAEQWLAGR